MTETRIDPEHIDEPYLHVVAAIVWHCQENGCFLIAQRQRGKHLAEFWELPGGKLESEESPWQGLQRELFEEIGIEATRGRPFMKVYHRYTDRNILLDTWVVDEYQGEARSREQQSIAWVSVAELDEYRFPAADLPILEAVKKL